MSVNHICLEIPPLSAALRPRRCSAIAPCAAPRGARRCSCCGPCWKNGCAMFLAALLEVSYGDDTWIPGVFKNSDVQLVLEVRNSWGCISTCHEYNPLLGVENHLHLRSLTKQQVSSSWWLNKGLLILSSDQWRCWKTWQVGWRVNCTNKVVIFWTIPGGCIDNTCVLWKDVEVVSFNATIAASWQQHGAGELEGHRWATDFLIDGLPTNHFQG